MFRTITTYELASLIHEVKIHLLDIRSEEDYKKGHISGSMNIQEKELLKNHKLYLDKTDDTYLISSDGEVSKRIGHKLSQLGYYIVSIVGGYQAWKGTLEKEL